MPDRELVWNPQADRYEWARVHYDQEREQNVAYFEAGGRMAMPRDHLRDMSYRYRADAGAARAATAQLRVANMMAQRYGTTFVRPEVGVVVTTAAAPRRARVTPWRLARRLLRRWLWRVIPRPPRLPVRTSVIHRAGFGGRT